MSGSVTMVLLVGLMFLFIIGLYVAIGIIIYRDAKAHELPAGVWTTVAILIPNLIGVILYLVVRANKEKAMYCSNCKTKVEKDYNICPQCKGIFEETCKVCNKPVLEGQVFCPYCGAESKEGLNTKTATKMTKKTNIAKPLIIVSVVYFVSLFAILFALIGIGSNTYLSEVTMDEVKVNGLRSGFSTVSIDTSTREKIKHTFQYTTEVTSRKLKVYADENPQIDIAISLEGGVIEIQILNENKEVVFEKVYEGSIEEGKPKQMIDEVPLQIREDQQYSLKFIYRKATNGKVEITG